MTTVRRLGAAALVALACLAVTARPVAAEWFADVYAGVSFIDKDDVRVNDRSVGIATYRDIDFDTGLAYGLRFGKYFDGAPFIGIGLDGFHYGTTIGPQSVRADGCVPTGACGTNRVRFGAFDVEASAFSLDLFLRVPLMTSKDAPGGKIQPYVLAGLPLFVTSITPRNTRIFRDNDGDTELSFGYKGGVGLAFYVFKHLMLFGEYRFTHTSPDFELRNATGAASKATLRTDLDTHTGLAGLSARW